jgi:hypothetical protein
MNSDEKKQPHQTTVTPDDDAITSRELTPEELERVSGGFAEGPMAQASSVTTAQ